MTEQTTMPLTFQSLLSTDNVFIDVEAGSKKHALQILSQRLTEAAPATSSDDIFDALLERERWGCTATEGGVAVPHARLQGVFEPCACVLRLGAPIDFDSPQDEKVDILFGFIVADDADEAATEQLRLLTQRVLDASLIQALREAPDSPALFDVLKHDDHAAERLAASQLATGRG
ncbi:MAG: PTS sugar transporter subunit IIA [Pseudomonadota bacterium]